MSQTSFASQQPQQKKLWANEAIRAYRAASHMQKLTGSDENNVIQELNELTPNESGAICGVGLIADLVGSGVLGDNELEGHEESMDSSWIEVELDQIRHAVRERGRMDNQRAVFSVRKSARDRLAFWRVRVMEEFQILCLSGVNLKYQCDGSLRPVLAGNSMEFMKSSVNVTAPSANRHYVYDGTNLVVGDTTTITSAFVWKWNAIVDAKALAITKGLKPLRMGTKELHVLLMYPDAYAQLKKDPDYRGSLVAANDDFRTSTLSGADITINGMMILTTERAFNTKGAPSGSKWGASGTVNGTRSLLLGCQALIKADIHTQAQWNEKLFSYDSVMGISISMMIGFTKAKFKSNRPGELGNSEDFGVIAIDTYLTGGTAS